MSRDTNNQNTQDMEQIQRGLEEFLQKELAGMNDADYNGDRTGNKTRYRDGYDTEYDAEDVEDDYEGGQREVDIIGSRRNRVDNRRGRDSRDDYLEDWDSEDFRRGGSGYRNSEDFRRGGSGYRNHRYDEDRYEDDEDEYDEEYDDRRKKRTSRGKAGNQRSRNSGRTGQKANYTVRNTNQTGKHRNDTGENTKHTVKESKKKHKKKSKLKSLLIKILIIVAILMAAMYFVVGLAYSKMKYEKIDSVAMSPMKEDGVTNILLIGNDSRDNGEDGRSDAMILLSISNKTKKIYMTSLLRDMYVEIPGHDPNRLNAAYSFGGAELLMETIEQNFDIKINRYVLVNFEAFANLVDAVGGVDLELSSEEIEYVNGYLVEYNMLLNRPQGTDNMDTSVSGMVHLNGAQALAYSRNRYLGTDFGRTERQRKVLSAVIGKLPKAVLTNPKGLVDGLMPNLTTNLTQLECYRLGLSAGKLVSYDIVQSSLPLDGTYQNATIRKMAVLQVDFDANKQYLKENIYGE